MTARPANQAVPSPALSPYTRVPGLGAAARHCERYLTVRPEARGRPDDGYDVSLTASAVRASPRSQAWAWSVS